MRKYRVTYSLRVTTNRGDYTRHFSYDLEAFCKLAARIKFRSQVKHAKHYDRKIISVRRIKQ